jgi:hypothetical protein
MKDVLTNGGNWESQYQLPEKYQEEKVESILDLIGGEHHDAILDFLLLISSKVDKLSGENNHLQLVFQDDHQDEIIDDASRCSSDSDGTVDLLDGDDNSEIYPRDDDEYSIEHEENLIEDIDIE